MKKLLMLVLFVGMLFSGLEIFSPSKAEAVDVNVNNQIGKKLAVAVVYFDENVGEWLCQGWWTVQPNSFKSISFPRHNKSNIYVHMHNASRSWGSGRAWTVTSNAFKYVIKNGCPAGNNRRKVAFNKYAVGQSGTIRLNVR